MSWELGASWSKESELERAGSELERAGSELERAGSELE